MYDIMHLFFLSMWIDKLYKEDNSHSLWKITHEGTIMVTEKERIDENQYQYIKY